MFLQRIISKATLLLFCIVSSISNAQPFQTSRYNKEYNPYFKFETFERGVKSELLAKKLDILEQKEKLSWNESDSIDFAEISLLTSNIELSHHYLESIVKSNSHKSDKAVHLLLMDCYLENDFQTGDKIVSQYMSNENPFDKFFISIYNAKKTEFQGNKVDSSILNILTPGKQDFKKGSDEFYKQIIEPIEMVNQVLRFFVKFVPEDDPVLAKAFNELGEVLEKKVSLNQAYIAYSIARTYNNKDKTILENVKRIKAKHVQKNYNTPKFRAYFPRTEYWRFDYEILKEKIIQKKNDTIPKFKPNLTAPSKEIKIPFPKDLLIPLGILVIFLLFVIFTKSQKR